MTPTAYQKPEIRDSNDNIIQQGAFGKNTALSNATNDGWIDYVANDLEALNNNKADKNAYLPLTGGTMTGNIQANTEWFSINNVSTAKRMAFYAGTGDSTGGALYLYGKDYSSTSLAGAFIVEAGNGTTAKKLTGKPDGSLTWNENNVITSAGGTFTGDIVYSHKYSKLRNSYTNNEGSISINGGDSDNDGARFIAYGKNYNGGKFTASANNGTNSSILEGTANGTLTWAGQNVLTASNYNSYALPLSGGTITGDVSFNESGESIISKSQDNSLISVYGATSYAKGAFFTLFGKDYSDSSVAGTFRLAAQDGTNNKMLVGKPNGTLTWGGNNVITSAGGTFTGGVTFNNQATTFAEKYAKLQSGYSNDEGLLSFNGGNGDNTGARLVLYGKNYGSTGGGGTLYFNVNNGTATKTFQAKPDGTLTWDGQPIQTSSDKRIKQDFSDVPDEVLEAWGKVNWQQFKYIDDAERKGVNNCRFHTGLVAQDVKEIGEENNVDLLKYGILCHDVREAVEEEKDEDGNVVREASEAVDLWTIRYEEALAMEAAYQRRRADRLEERIARLEALLTNTETE